MQTVKGCPNGVTGVTYELREKAETLRITIVTGQSALERAPIENKKRRSQARAPEQY